MYAGFAPTQAQIGSTAVPLAVFVVDLTRPKLLQLPWFYRLYHRVLQWLAWAHTLIDPVKAEVRTWIARQVRPFAPRVRSMFLFDEAETRGTVLRQAARIWRRVQSVRPAE